MYVCVYIYIHTYIHYVTLCKEIRQETRVKICFYTYAFRITLQSVMQSDAKSLSVKTDIFLLFPVGALYIIHNTC